jgi:hypothetical protein
VSVTAGDGQVTVSWSAPASDGGSAITGYTVTASPGGTTCAWTSGPLSCVVTGLTNGTGYTFTVTAMNAAGTSAASTASGAVPAAAAVPRTAEAGPSSRKPAAPVGLVAHLHGGTLALRWRAGKGGGAIDHYLILRNGAQVASTIATHVSLRAYAPHVPNRFRVVAVGAGARRATGTGTVTVTWAPRPHVAPSLIPRWSWRLLAWQERTASKRGVKPHVPAPLPAWYGAWRTWRLNPHVLQKS